MPNLDTKGAVHSFPIKKGVSLKKQPQWRFHLELISETENGVNKLIDARFIRHVKY